MMDASFTIEHPRWLWMVWAIPALIAAWAAAWAWDKRAMKRHFSAELLSRLTANVSYRRRWMKLFLLAASLLFFIISLAEPKWGETEQTVITEGRDILVLLDVSKSMLAADVAPSRLERVKLDLADMTGALRGDRIGLIVFAGAPVMKCPLTTDYGFFRQALEKSGVHSVSRGGTFIGDAIRLAIESFTDQTPKHKAVILISDGEDQGSFPLDAARQAAELGIKIYAIGIGDRDIGSRIQVGGQFVTDDGKVVWTKLNPEELRKIALETGGAYIPAGTRSIDLVQIYKQKIASVEAKKLEETKKKFVESRYQLFLFIGILLILAESAISDRRTQWRAKLSMILAALAVCISPSRAFAEVDAYDLYNEGRDYFSQGHFDSAALLFSAAARRSDGRSKTLESDAYYNLGNAFFKSAERAQNADLSSAIESLRKADASYRESLARNSSSPDARHNLELSRLMMQRLMAEQQKQKSSEKQKGKNGASDTAAGKQDGNSDGQENQKSDDPQSGKKEEERKTAEMEKLRGAELKDRLKGMEELKKKLFEMARRKGIDPERDQNQPAGAVTGGGYKDW